MLQALVQLAFIASSLCTVHPPLADTVESDQSYVTEFD